MEKDRASRQLEWSFWDWLIGGGGSGGAGGKG